MRLIDANAFNEYLESGEYCKNCRNIDTPSCCDCPIIQAGLLTFMRMIDEQPTIEEHKVERWKAKDFHTCYCPNCNFAFDIMNCDFMDKMMFCPNCGAKMEGVDE